MWSWIIKIVLAIGSFFTWKNRKDTTQKAKEVKKTHDEIQAKFNEVRKKENVKDINDILADIDKHLNS